MSQVKRRPGCKIQTQVLLYIFVFEGVKLINKCGGLVFGPKDDSHIIAYAKAMASQGIPFETVGLTASTPYATSSRTHRVSLFL